MFARSLPALAALIWVSCYHESDYDIGGKDGLRLDAVVRVECAPLTIFADGSAKATCTATIPPDVPEAERQLTFRTTAGFLVTEGLPKEQKVTAVRKGKSGKGEAVVELASKSVGSADVTATIADITSEPQTVTFVELPEVPAASIRSVTADGFALEASALRELAVRAELVDAVGKVPTPGQEVQVKIFDVPSSDVGTKDACPMTGLAADPKAQYRALKTSDGAGLAAFVVTAGDTDYRGDLMVQVCLERDPTICNCLVLPVVAPLDTP